jgi:putative transposase
MKASKFTEAQIAFVLRQTQDGAPVAEVCRKAGISDATFYNWRKKYAGLAPSEIKRLRQPEEENAKLKRIVPICRWTRPCCRTCCQESCEAWPQTRTCRQAAKRLEGIDQASLLNSADRSRALRLQVEARRPDRSEASDQGDLRDAGTLRISSHPRLAALRRLGSREAHLSP